MARKYTVNQVLADIFPFLSFHLSLHFLFETLKGLFT